VFGAVVAGLFGFYPYLYAADVSKLGFITLALFFLSSLWVGQMSYRSRDGNQDFSRHLQFGWWVAELFMGLGMIGTLVGFLVMLQALFSSGINIEDPTAARTLLSRLAYGLSTSALTTLVGLIASQVFKLQLVNLEYLLGEEFKKQRPFTTISGALTEMVRSHRTAEGGE
jgi:hypothetical protein